VLPNQIEINDVALPVYVCHANLHFVLSGCRKEGSPQLFRISAADSNGSKDASLVTAARML